MTPEDSGERRNPWLPVNTSEPDVPEESLTPTKPLMPSWIQRDEAPQPVEVDDTDVMPPVPVPPAQEMLPSTPPPVPEAGSISPYDPPTTDANWGSDAVHRLGAAAVTNASLSAGGAPTPLGGVPVEPADQPVEAPSFGDTAPLFTPKFTDDPGASAANGLHPTAADLETGAQYQPRFEPPVAPVETNEVESSDEPPRARRGLAWLWIVLVVLAVGVGAAVIWLTVLKPEPQTVPGAVITVAPPEATVEPVPLESPTALLAAMPPVVSTYALTAAEPLEPAAVAVEHGRVADAAALTYWNGTEQIDLTVLQYYSEDEAEAAWMGLVGEGVTGEPVIAGGAEVGASAAVVQPEPGIVWRNGTSVFIANGPPLELRGFFDAFGL